MDLIAPVMTQAPMEDIRWGKRGKISPVFVGRKKIFYFFLLSSIFSLRFYVLFWFLSLYDLYVPVAVYAQEEEKLQQIINLANDPSDDDINVSTEPVYANLTQTAHHGLNLTRNQFFSRISEEILILLHEFALILEFDTALLLQIRFESGYHHFCFKSLIESSKRKVHFWCKPPFYSDTVLLVAYESAQKFERKLFPRGKKLLKSNGKPSQSTNQSTPTVSNCDLTDFHSSSAKE